MKKDANTAKKQKYRASKHKSAGSRNGDDRTAQKLLRAARTVFSLHSYKAATTPMIAREAGVEHPLIHYHYGSKKELFEAVASQMFEEFEQAHHGWLEGLEAYGPREGLSLYIDRLLVFCTEHPEQLQFVSLNMVQIGRLEELPGYRYVVLHMDRIRSALEQKLLLKGLKLEVDRLILCFHMLLVSFIGARGCQAQALRMDPDSEGYREWVKESLLSLCLPLLMRLNTSREQE